MKREAKKMNLIGRKIIKVRDLTTAEIKEEGWEEGTLIIILDDGSKIFPSQDQEGNGPGSLFGIKKDGTPVRV